MPIRESEIKRQSTHGQEQLVLCDTRSQHEKDSRAAQLFIITDKILIACLGVTMEMIAEEFWTDKVMGHKFP